MDVPKDIFIDTNIFESQNYNFSSREFAKFKDHLKNSREKRLLLPDPTRQEIERHLKDWAKAAANVVVAAENDFPMLRRISFWPTAPLKKKIVREEMHASARKDFADFIDAHQVMQLDYSGVELATVMEWYDQCKAPFAEGSKRKEFPDAIVVAMLEHHHKETKRNVAVISNDNDFKKACASRGYLQSYPTLSSYVEASSAFDEMRTGRIRNMLNFDMKLQEAVSAAFLLLNFVIEEDWEGTVSDVKTLKVNFFEQNIVSMDDEGFEISFQAEVLYMAQLDYEDVNSGTYDREDDRWIFRDQINVEAEENAVLAGSAIFYVNEEWTEIVEMPDLTLDQHTINIVTEPAWHD